MIYSSLLGKEKTQEEFFHTFNALHQTNKQIIISSDKPPKTFLHLKIACDLVLLWGMSIDMQTPDLKRGALSYKPRQRVVALNYLAMLWEYLSQGVRTNIRELEGGIKPTFFSYVRNAWHFTRYYYG